MPQHTRLLKKAFSAKEWEYLLRHDAFKALTDGCDTLYKYERLVEIGMLLLRQKEELQFDPLRKSNRTKTINRNGYK